MSPHGLRSLWFSIAWSKQQQWSYYCTLCKEPGHRQKRARCKFHVCNKCGAAGHSVHVNTNVIKPDATNAAARPTQLLRASRVPNTSTPIASARSNRRATTEMTALECKPRYATNAAKLATARTHAPFVRAMHVAFEVRNYNQLFVYYALCVTAKKSQKVTITLYAHMLRAKHASLSATGPKTALTLTVWTSTPIGLHFVHEASWARTLPTFPS